MNTALVMLLGNKNKLGNKTNAYIAAAVIRSQKPYMYITDNSVHNTMQGVGSASMECISTMYSYV